MRESFEYARGGTGTAGAGAARQELCENQREFHGSVLERSKKMQFGVNHDRENHDVFMSYAYSPKIDLLPRV